MERMSCHFSSMSPYIGSPSTVAVAACTSAAVYVSTTILPPALFSSMHRWASTMSSRRKILPT